MVKFDEHIDEIRETKKQIGLTESKQRKYELHRHLDKLVRELRRGRAYYLRSVSNG